MFTGAAGIGKLEFAEHLAQSLLCERPQAGHRPCGECEACRWYLHGTHPDFRRLSPLGDEDEEGKEGAEGKKVSRKLPVIKIEAVREVIDFAHLSAHRAGRRIVLVEPAESLNPAAANALLKILEEPPAEVLFLLVAHAPQRLLPTIRSRCRQFPLTRPDQAQASAGLAARARRGRRRTGAGPQWRRAAVRPRSGAGQAAWPVCSRTGPTQLRQCAAAGGGGG
ncbi:DNA polymerase III subunit delta' [Chromobacterium haemolyticum]|nr:DNA polymerase III subunit delta' [Chromobacterium haemolyticum]